MPRSYLLVSLLALAPFTGCWRVAASNDLRVRNVAGDDFTLEVFDNSRTLSRALAINATGQIIGLREVADEAGTQLSEQPFFFDGQKMTTLPLLDGYTNLEIRALSDSGSVVGYASRPLGHPQGSLTGFVWDSKTGKMTRLMPAGQDTGCHAQAISADGTRITGYTAGSLPSRMLPCLWTWSAATKTWDIQTLDTLEEFNPYIMSSNVLISPDGQRIVACITVAALPNNIFDSSLFQWTRVDGQWQRQLLSDEQMNLSDINNSGQIAGTVTTQQGRRPCRIESSGEIKLIELLPGDESGEARAIDESGTVVGFSDDPAGPTGGPQAFVWSHGSTRPLALPRATTASMAFGINEAGQIAGLLDVASSAAAVPDSDQPDSDLDDLNIQTLAFRWTPKVSAK